MVYRHIRWYFSYIVTGHSHPESKFLPAVGHLRHGQLGFFIVLSLPRHIFGRPKTSLTSLPSKVHPDMVRDHPISDLSTSNPAPSVTHTTSCATMELKDTCTTCSVYNHKSDIIGRFSGVQRLDHVIGKFLHKVIPCQSTSPFSWQNGGKLVMRGLIPPKNFSSALLLWLWKT